MNWRDDKMGKVFKVLGIILLVLVVLLGIGAWYFYSNILPAKQEYAMYNRTRLNKTIDEQLKDINLKEVRKKSNLILEKTVPEIQEAISQGKLTYKELTAFYLDRISQFDQIEHGINAISEINPNAMKIAEEFDNQRKEISNQGQLFGMPVTLKENINTSNLITSAGTYALKKFIPKEDAPVVKDLLDQDAFILAKTNLSELANFMSTRMPSGYSSKHGQTLNPYNPLVESPLGSSSGSAASITANIGVISLGTETTGSLISPAAIESTVGFKPTHGNIKDSGVFPLASSLDTVGIIARNVTDVATFYNELTTIPETKVDIKKFKTDYLKGKRIGFPAGADENLYNQMKKELEKQGAEVVKISIDSKKLDNLSIINNEMKFDIEKFAEEHNLPFRTLGELIEFNNKDKKRRAKYGQNLIEKANETKAQDKKAVQDIIDAARKQYDSLMAKHSLDTIVFLDNDYVPLTAIAGYPEITIPVGLDKEGKPRGLTFTTSKNADNKALEFAFSFETNTKLRNVLSDQELIKNLEKNN